MFCQLAFSGQAFERLIKYRIADLFRPLSDTVDHKGQKSWLDGMLVTAINFTPVANDRFVIVNQRANDSILPNPNGYGYQAGAVRMDLTTEFYFVLDQDVKTAGLRQPPFQTELVTGTALRVTIRAGVDANGVPMIQLELDTDALKGLPLPPDVIGRIGGSVSAAFPFDIGSIVKDIFPPGNDKVLNAGITRDDDNAIVMRFEFPGTAWQSDIAHAQDWQRFFSLDFHANLDGQEWCMDLDGSAVAAGLAVVMDPSFKNEKPIRFDAGWIDSGFIDGDTPRVVITKHARIENACAGNDVRFGAFANLDLSVPTENLLRAELSFDIDKDDGDIARCLGLGLINPFSVFITAVDNGQLGIGFAELAASFVFPTKAFIAMSAIGLLFVGVDKTVARKVIDDKLKDNPKITKLPDGGSAYDRALKPQSELTKDWLFLKRCVGRDGRLLLTGDLRVPDAVLPRLTASDLEGLSKWTLVDKCDPGKGQVADGTLTLSLTPGYGADKASVQPVKVPTISLKWGVRPDGGDLIYDVLNDDLGIYKNQVPEYRQVYVPGIPGIVEATLKASTVRMKAFSPFGPRPYPLRLRFYTSGGVREYQFAAPPVLQDFVETNHDAFIRINNCKHRGASLVFHRYLSLKWLGNPSPELGESAQQWEVHVRGLTPGRKATVWNQDSGAPLVNLFADRTGRVDVALVLPSGQRADALLIGLDDEPFRSAAQMRRETSNHQEPRTAPPEGIPEVAVRQTLLTPVQHLDFEDPIDTLSLADAAGYSTLVVQTVQGQRFAHTLPSPYNAGLAVTASEPSLDVTEERPERHGQLVWRGRHRQFLMLSQRLGRTDVLAEYSARSAYDLGASREDLFAQVSADGRRLTLYQKGAALQLGSHEWVEDTAKPVETYREPATASS